MRKNRGMQRGFRIVTMLALLGVCAPLGLASNSTTLDLDSRDYELTVSSAQGNPSPAVGTHSAYAWRSVVSCSVASPVSGDGSTYQCTGWTGTGAVPATGATNQTGSLVLSVPTSSITWSWSEQVNSYPVTFDLDGKGTRSGGGATNQSIDHGSAAAAPTVQANAGWIFDEWDSTFSNITNGLTVTAQYLQAFALDVSSAQGTPIPEVGTNSYAEGSALNCSVSSPVVIGLATQYVCKGWTMTGHDPSSGSTTSFSMNITNNASLTWLWSTNITISNHPGGMLQFKSVSYSVSEEGGSVRVYISRTGGSDGAVSVDYATSSGSALAGVDYVSQYGTREWGSGSLTDRFVDIPVLSDDLSENREMFTITLSDAMGAGLGDPSVAVVTIAGPNDQPPPGGTVTTNTYDLSGLCRIWDISGTYQNDMMDGTITLAQDGKGKLWGGGNYSASMSGVSVNATFTVKGKLKSEKDGSTSGQIQIKHKGTASQSGQTYKFSANQKITASIDSDDLEMNGQMETSVSLAGQKIKQIEVFSEDLPIGMDGSAVLTIETQRDAKGKIIGSGSCELSNLEELSFVVKGKPNSKTGTVKLSLKGRKETGDSGAKIQMEVFGDYQDIESMKGKVMGQTILVD